MIDDLLKTSREERWSDATKLIYKHWVSASKNVYPTHLDKPWEEGPAEIKIGFYRILKSTLKSNLANELLYPLAVMFCAEPLTQSRLGNHEREPDGPIEALDCSLRKLKDIVDIDDAKNRSGQICGRMFKNGEPNYSCK
jgi:hypothetical protein